MEQLEKMRHFAEKPQQLFCHRGASSYRSAKTVIFTESLSLRGRLRRVKPSLNR